MKKIKHLIDTTLRDGEQSPGFAFDCPTKLKIAAELDKLGIYQIEAGIPAIGKDEKQSILSIMESRKNSRISVWNRMNISDIEHSFDCTPDVIHISAPVSYVQIYTKLKKNKVWLVNTLAQCIDFAQAKGYAVTVGMEDASRADITFISTILKMLSSCGVELVRYADTVGVLTPSQTENVIKEIKTVSNITIEIHTHNDLGMAVANSVAAAKAGVDYIDCTLFGIGERAGNCNLEHFVRYSKQCFDFGFPPSKLAEAQNSLKELILGGGS